MCGLGSPLRHCARLFVCVCLSAMDAGAADTADVISSVRRPVEAKRFVGGMFSGKHSIKWQKDTDLFSHEYLTTTQSRHPRFLVAITQRDTFGLVGSAPRTGYRRNICVADGSIHRVFPFCSSCSLCFCRQSQHQS